MDNHPRGVVVIGDKIVSWVMGISSTLLIAFMIWLGTTVLEMRTAVDHLGSRIGDINASRSEAVAIVNERLNQLSIRMDSLELAIMLSGKGLSRLRDSGMPASYF